VSECESEKKYSLKKKKKSELSTKETRQSYDSKTETITRKENTTCDYKGHDGHY
jgi:hypothetical protein